MRAQRAPGSSARAVKQANRLRYRAECKRHRERVQRREAFELYLLRTYGSVSVTAEPIETTYYATNGSKVRHSRPDCKALVNSSTVRTLTAEEAGQRSDCRRCGA